MKKFLSLVLALVMTMSLVTISAGAKDFADNSKIQYQEAVDVMSAVKVIDGYEDGSFNPQGTLTRGAAAKIICNLILGPTTASALSADTAPYKDVPTNHTFAGYIAYCQQKGIISGYADGTFRPAGTLTSYAFMKMLLGALGYDANIEQYVGDNWSIAVAKQALSIGLADDLVGDFIGTNAVTREEACLYALNTMQATMVEYGAKTTVNVSGATVTVAGSDAKPVEWDTGSKRDGNIGKADGFIQFAEQYFSDLKLNDKATDDFARPANQWKLKAEEIGTYTHTPDASYTKKVEVGDIYKDLGLGNTIEKKNVEVYVNGVEKDDQAPVAIKKSDDDNKYGANGVLTEVFYDEDDDSVIITEIETFVGTIAKTVKATDKKDAYVVVTPESPLNGKLPFSGNEEFETNEEFEDDAYVLYTYSEDADEIKSVALAEKIEGVVTRAENDKENDKDSKALTIDGTKYKDSKYVAGETLSDVSVKSEYTVYLDAYGYMIYVEENEEIGDYALLLDVANKGNFVGKKAELVFTDGTSKVVTTEKDYTDVDNLKLDMKQEDFYTKGSIVTPVIVTYKVDDDGVYTLRAVDTAKSSYDLASDALFLKNDKAGIKVKSGTVTANSATVFVVRDTEDTDDYTPYTGIKNAPTIDTTGAGNDATKKADVFYYCKSNKMVTVMFILPGKNVDVEDDSNNSVYLAVESVSNLIHDNDGDYYEFEAVVNGEKKTVKVDENVKIDGVKVLTSTTTKQLNGIFKSYSVDKHGIITSLKTYQGIKNNNAGVETKDKRIQPVATYTGETDAKEYVSLTGINKVSKEYTILVGYQSKDKYEETITVDKDADIFYVDEDGKISVSSYSGISIDDNDKVYAVVEDYQVQLLVIEEVGAPKDTYGVYVQTADNATVRVDGSKVAVGKTEKYEKNDEDVVITVTPDKDYEIKNVKINGEQVELNKNNEYTISKIKGLYTVGVTAEKIPAETMTVIVNYVADGKDVGQEVVTVEDTGSKTLTIKADDLKEVPDGYVTVTTQKVVAFDSVGVPEVTFVVRKAQATLDVTSKITGWSIDAVSKKTVEAGDEITIAVKRDAAGAYDATKMHQFTWTAGDLTVTTVELTTEGKDASGDDAAVNAVVTLTCKVGSLDADTTINVSVQAIAK